MYAYATNIVDKRYCGIEDCNEGALLVVLDVVAGVVLVVLGVVEGVLPSHTVSTSDRVCQIASCRIVEHLAFFP